MGGGLIRRTVGEIEIDGGFRFFLNETNLTLWHQGLKLNTLDIFVSF